jgi:hypothetical protein
MPARALIRLVPAVLMALFCVAAFIVASGYSSQITSSAGTEVLIDGTNCGFITSDEYNNIDVISNFNRKLVNALNYAQQCYNTDSPGLADCENFVTSRIPMFLDKQAPCPFPGPVCRTNTSNLLLDTGFINSHDHHGINAPADERLFLRAVLHCAPLVTTGFSQNYTGRYSNYTLYDYGPSGPSIGSLNFTYMARSLENQYSFDRGEVPESDYLLVCVGPLFSRAQTLAHTNLVSPAP